MASPAGAARLEAAAGDGLALLDALTKQDGAAPSQQPISPGLLVSEASVIVG